MISALGFLPKAKPTQVKWMSREEVIMGTAIRVELWHEQAARGEAALDAVMEEMHRIDRAMSPFKPESELSRINREAARAPVPVSEEMFELLTRSVEFSKLSEGAFDITFASVGCMFDYRNGVKPTEEEIEAALPGFDYRHIRLEREGRTIQFARAGVQIDLGGIAKGHAVDNCVALLEERGVKEALVVAGGDSRVLGDRRGRPWMIGIRDPRRKDTMVATMPLVDGDLHFRRLRAVFRGGRRAPSPYPRPEDRKIGDRCAQRHHHRPRCDHDGRSLQERIHHGPRARDPVRRVLARDRCSDH